MLTKVFIRNFKLFKEEEIELGERVVFIGPNNSGKTSVLQALALWDIGLKRWIEKRGTGKLPKKRPGVTINRRDLITVPVPDANLLWRNLHVREVSKEKGKMRTHNIRIDILVEGVSDGVNWKSGLEFDYANEESIYCRPLRLSNDKDPDRMDIPEQASNIKLAFLPPMSGLAANETRLDPGAINVRLGEGRTAEVLRNLCYKILEPPNEPDKWLWIVERIKNLFGDDLEKPKYIPERGEIVMSYLTHSEGIRLDISSTGRGLQQTLLLLTHMMVNPRSILLLDEPDAHLEILRQRQIYQLLTDTAREHNSQIVAASHSEIILNEAADRDMVIAFVGHPHRIDDRGSQVLKSLREIGYEQYYQAEETGWVLYLEGSTDLAILRVFAEILEHPAQEFLERPFVWYVQNLPRKAKAHFYGLREAKPDLVGIALYDYLEKGLDPDPTLDQHMWKKREIENYLCTRDVLLAWAEDAGHMQNGGPLFAQSWRESMEQTMNDIEKAMLKLRKASPWDPITKVTDDFLNPLFEDFFEKLKLPNLMWKTGYHELARYLKKNQIEPEVSEKLDAIVQVANKAKPRII